MARNAALILFVLLMVTGCATAPPAKPHVVLEPDGDLWRATWNLAAPARELRFDRDTSFRGEHFEVLTPGYAIVREGNNEVLRTDEVPSSTIAVRFREHTRHLPKDYKFFLKFSDGSVAIYTGHLLATAGDMLVRDFRFQPRGTNVIVAGQRHSAAVHWRDASGQGTYVYFGSIEPVESADAISIVDPGLPDWLETRAREALPRLFALYTDRLAAKLPERPAVLFNYVNSEQTGYSRNGGTLPGLIALEVEGTGWQSESDEGLLELFHFLAHEAAHLWNGQIVSYPDSADAWLHEGSADGLAERALLELGVIDQERFRRYQTAALNQCRRGLGAEPLQTAAKRGQFELYYSCGNALALLTEQSTGQGLFSFWKALIARALATKDRQYTAADYYTLLGDRAEVVRGFVERPADPDALVRALRAHGVVITTAETPPEDYGQPLARQAMLHLLAGGCTGSYGFNASTRGLILSTPLRCESFAGGEIVEMIGGFHVLREGHLAFDHVQERCGSEGLVTVGIAGGRTIEVPCRKPLAARPAYVRIERIEKTAS